jgi:hypothetical protein
MKRRRWREERGEWPGIYTISCPFHRDWGRIPFEHIPPKMESGHRERASHVVTTFPIFTLVYHSGPFCNHHRLSEKLPTWIKPTKNVSSHSPTAQPRRVGRQGILQSSIRPLGIESVRPAVPPLHGSQRRAKHRLFPEKLHDSC